MRARPHQSSLRFAIEWHYTLVSSLFINIIHLVVPNVFTSYPITTYQTQHVRIRMYFVYTCNNNVMRTIMYHLTRRSVYIWCACVTRSRTLCGLRLEGCKKGNIVSSSPEGKRCKPYLTEETKIDFRFK